MSRFLKFYSECLQKYPTILPITQTTILMGSGDAIAQCVIEKKNLKDYNLKRTSQFMFLGAVLVGPSLTVWYRILARKFGTVGTPAVALKKIACDQGFFAPTFLVIFMSSLGFVQQKSWEDTKKEIKEKYTDILFTNYSIWPLANLCNFYFMPIQYQVLFANVVALFWNSYISWKTQERIEEHRPTEKGSDTDLQTLRS